MRIDFTKMHGVGNDFVVLDPPADESLLQPERLRTLADRRTGIGFDQALVLQKPRRPDTAVFYRIFNADGDEVEQCGNGARCIAALLYSRAPQLGRQLVMDSLGGTVRAQIREDGQVSVDMGVPNFDPSALPMVAAGGGALAEASSYSLSVDGVDLEIGAVSMGNPHAVLRVPDVKSAPIARFGPSIESHARFPRRVNVGFMQIVGRDHIRLRVYERGAGETLACGTGACAAVAVGRRHGLLDAEVKVDLPGGGAEVSWAAMGERLWLTGPATTVFAGSIDI